MIVLSKFLTLLDHVMSFKIFEGAIPTFMILGCMSQSRCGGMTCRSASHCAPNGRR